MFSQYILILGWIGLMAVVVNAANVKEIEFVNGNKVERYNWIFAFVVFLPVIWMAANRGFFADTSSYIWSYQNMPDAFADISEYMSTVNKDKGFYFLSAILRCILGYEYMPYLFILALFQGISIVIFFRKHSMNYILSIFLFLASADYISWMYNGLRQFMAVTIILFATPLMLKKKYFPLILIVLLASTMHQSALLMILFVLIAQGEAWNKKTIAVIIGSLIAIMFVGQFTTILDDSLQTSQYMNVVSDYTEWQDDGTNPIRVLVYSIPALIAFFGRKNIIARNNQLINFCTNMSIISMGLYLVSMVTSGIFIGRLPIYCSLYSYILLPWEVDNLFDDTNKRTITIIMIFAYLVFYYYQMHITYGLF